MIKSPRFSPTAAPSIPPGGAAPSQPQSKFKVGDIVEWCHYIGDLGPTYFIGVVTDLAPYIGTIHCNWISAAGELSDPKYYWNEDRFEKIAEVDASSI